MNEWEKDCILRNLQKLVKFTQCNISLLTTLLSEKILTEEETHIIFSKPTQHEKAFELYTLLLTRRNAFSKLKVALEETSQTGALKLLALPDEESYNKYKKLVFDENDVIANYCNLVTLHKGKFGTREVTIKQYRNVDINSLDRAKNELNMLLNLDWHENIVRCFIAKYIIREHHHHFAVALDYQKNLAELKGAALDKKLRGAFIFQILNAVMFLHDCRILHLNLKPEAIFVNCHHPVDWSTATGKTNTRIQIGEFGISKQLEPGQDIIQMCVKNLEGTGSYNTPEVQTIVNKIPYAGYKGLSCDLGYTTDIFNLGAVFYYLLTGGKTAFGPRPLELRRKIAYENPSLDDMVGMSIKFKHYVLLMLSREQSDRPNLNELQNTFKI